MPKDQELDPSTAEEQLSRMMVKELERYGKAKNLYPENATSQQKLEALVAEYRKKLGVPEERFPVKYVENLPSLGHAAKREDIPGPTIMGQLSVIGKKPDEKMSQRQYEQALASYVHELRHARDFMSDTELTKNLAKEYKHFKEAPAGKKEYGPQDIAEEGDLWAILRAQQEAEEAEALQRKTRQ